MFKIILFISILFTGGAYMYAENHPSDIRIIYLYLILYIVNSFSYIYNYRRHDIVCFETLFLSINFLVAFFDILVINVVPGYDAAGLNLVSNKSMLKVHILQMVALFAFLYGASNSSGSVNLEKYREIRIQYDFSIPSKIMTYLCLADIVLLAANGTILSWFQYISGKGFVNESLNYLTIFILVASCLEISRVASLGVRTICGFFVAVNKIYLFEVFALTAILMVSGNRNEALMICLPPLFMFSVLVKHISNIQYLAIVGAGIVLMIGIGLTRATGVSLGAMNEASSEMSWAEASRDYVSAYINSHLLVEYTDDYGIRAFTDVILVFVSAVPYLGTLIMGMFDIGGTSTGTIANNLIYGIDDSLDSGVGTSLLGDVYYTGSIIGLLLFYYLLGRLISHIYNILRYKKIYNIWYLVIYSQLFSFVVYYPRAEWSKPVRPIAFACIIIFLLIHFFKSKRYEH